MVDLLHALLKWVDHNRYVAAGVGVSAVLLVVLAACEPKAQSPFTHEPVTQGQLLAQVQAFEARLQGQAKAAHLSYQQTLVSLEAEASAGQVNAQAALDDIAQRKAAIALAVESLAQLTTAAAGAGYAPMIGSVVGVAGVLLGLGAAADSRRKDQVILKIKSGLTNDAADASISGSSTDMQPGLAQPLASAMMTKA